MKFKEKQKVKHNMHGEGVILKIQGDRANVQFEKNTIIIPISELEHSSDPIDSLIRGETPERNAFWRVQTKLLSSYIEAQNSVTSEFYNFKIKPLPHQFVALKRVIESTKGGNMLFADDVGLGKTIEAGLVINHIYQKKKGKARILILVPAGLKWQWREELQTKFGIFFNIWGYDTDPGPIAFSNKMGGVNLLIASQQRAVNGINEDLILEQVEKYHLVVIDECHRLSNSDTQLFRFIRDLNKKNFIDQTLMLSATPHFGVQERFLNILHLLDMDGLKISKEKEKYQSLENISRRDFLKQYIYRNDKLSVKDYNDKYLFKNIKIEPVSITLNKEETKFCESVIDYIKNLYKYSENKDQTTKRRTGFVIAIYKKMLDSSWKSVLEALKIRLKTLNGESIKNSRKSYDIDEMEGSEEKSEIELHSKLKGLPQIWNKEIQALESLIQIGNDLEKKEVDSKIDKLNEILNAPENKKDKFIIFTQYVRTLEIIQEALSKEVKFIPLIYGALSIEERNENIKEFRDKEKNRFLISTEAGGEGLNLQFAHKIINFDLPWNPARIQQRIGRVWRYGQTKDVVVYNFYISNSPYNEFLKRLDEKLTLICDEFITRVNFSNIPPELHDALIYHLKMEVLGDLDETSEAYPENILNETIDFLKTDRLNAAAGILREAIEVITQNREFYAFAADVNETEGFFTPKGFPVLQLFAESFAKAFNGDMLMNKKVIQFNLPNSAKDELKLDIQKINKAKFTLERYQDLEDDTIAFFGFGEEIFKKMISISNQKDFGGFAYASIKGLSKSDSIIHLVEADCNAEDKSESYKVSVAILMPGKTILNLKDLFSGNSNWKEANPKKIETKETELNEFDLDDILSNKKQELEKLRRKNFVISNQRISSSIGVIVNEN